MKEKGPRGAAGAATGNGWGSAGGRVREQQPENRVVVRVGEEVEIYSM